MTKEPFPQSDRVHTSPEFRKKKAKWVGTWKPTGEAIRACQIIQKSILNPKGGVCLTDKKD